MEEEFDYNKALEELEKIALRVENPETGIDEIDRLLRRSASLVTRCREYLRTVRTRMEEASGCLKKDR